MIAELALRAPRGDRLSCSISKDDGGRKEGIAPNRIE